VRRGGGVDMWWDWEGILRVLVMLILEYAFQVKSVEMFWDSSLLLFKALCDFVGYMLHKRGCFRYFD